MSGRPYRAEYIMIIKFSEEKKIESISEFVDSKYVVNVFQEEMALANATTA